MTRDELVTFLRRYRLAVQASVAADGAPQAAVVGFGVSDACEIVFDTLTTTRKYRNLAADPRIALVIGWEHEATAQIEGVVDFPAETSWRACAMSTSPRTRMDAIASPGPASRTHACARPGCGSATSRRILR
jgi:pyridoxine/pyridoxamine 5'-phosphate oxidase